MKILIAIYCLLVANIVFATDPTSDQIIVGGEQYGILEYPLSGYLRNRNPRVILDEQRSPSGSGGYYALWKIDHTNLFLAAFTAPVFAKPDSEGKFKQVLWELKDLIPSNHPPVHATWYSGSITIPLRQPDSREIVEGGYYTHRLVFSVKSGVVTNREIQKLGVVSTIPATSTNLAAFTQEQPDLTQRLGGQWPAFDSDYEMFKSMHQQRKVIEQGGGEERR